MTNHGWRSVRGKNRGRGGHGDQQRASGIRHGLGVVVSWALTLLAVMVSWVFFRALSFEGAMAVLRGMFGFNGLSLPQEWAASLQGLTAGTKGWVGFEGIQVNALPMGHDGLSLRDCRGGGGLLLSECQSNHASLEASLRDVSRQTQTPRQPLAPLGAQPTLGDGGGPAGLAFLSVTNLTSVSEFLFFSFERAR